MFVRYETRPRPTLTFCLINICKEQLVYSELNLIVVLLFVLQFLVDKWLIDKKTISIICVLYNCAGNVSNY